METPFPPPTMATEFLILLRGYSQMRVLRGTHLKLGCSVVSYLQLVRWHNIAQSRCRGAGSGDVSFFPFQVGTTSQSAVKSKCLLNTNFDSDCRLSFICSRKPSCGQVVTCKCCCLSNVFTLLVSNFSELLQFKKSTWWQRRKTVIHFTAILFNNAL